MSQRLAGTVAVILLLATAACTSQQPATTHPDHTSHAPISRATAQSKVARIAVTPAVVQPGTAVAPAAGAEVVVRASLARRRDGRAVVLQRRVAGGRWTDAARLSENASGTVRYVGPGQSPRGTAYSYRVVAAAQHGRRRAATPAVSPAAWHLRFSDEFAGNSLDRRRWGYRQLGVYAPASDRACAASYRDAVAVGGGRLQLSAFEDRARAAAIGPCDRRHDNTRTDERWFREGQIGTQGRGMFRFRYGFAAARIRFDHREGGHGSFWLQAAEHGRRGQLGPRHDGAEIDVVEYFGDAFAKWHEPDSVYSFVYFTGRHGQRVKVPADTDPTQAVTRRDAGLSPHDNWSTGYHVFSVRWTPQRYVFYVDGVRVRTVSRGVSDVPEYLVLSTLTSGWELPRFPPGARLRTNVDWVRVWQLPQWSCQGAPAC
jgi:beta-glucanase (GH16 family)